MALRARLSLRRRPGPFFCLLLSLQVVGLCAFLGAADRHVCRRTYVTGLTVSLTVCRARQAVEPRGDDGHAPSSSAAPTPLGGGGGVRGARGAWRGPC